QGAQGTAQLHLRGHDRDAQEVRSEPAGGRVSGSQDPNMNRKSFILSALALFAAAPALAQSAAATVDKPVTITFYNYNLASAGNGKDATERLIAEFMAANPNVTVTGVPYSSAEGNARLQADLAAGQPVDLVQLGFNSLDYARASYGAKALEDLIPADEI